jgi:hypothetical protein
MIEAISAIGQASFFSNEACWLSDCLLQYFKRAHHRLMPGDSQLVNLVSHFSYNRDFRDYGHEC